MINPFKKKGHFHKCSLLDCKILIPCARCFLSFLNQKTNGITVDTSIHHNGNKFTLLIFYLGIFVDKLTLTHIQGLYIYKINFFTLEPNIMTPLAAQSTPHFLQSI